MSIVAEFSIPPEAVPSGRTLTELPEITIQLERIVPTHQRVLPFFWVFDAESGVVLDHLRSEPGIDDVSVLTRIGNRTLFRAEWTPDTEIMEGIKTLQATILEAQGTADEWLFQVRAQNRERLSAFRQLFTDQGVPVEVRRIYNFAELIETGRPLTPAQREMLVAAYESGYYDQPRQVTQAELGEQFGISGRAVSNRLRRGTKNLVASTLLSPAPHDGS